jgi:hypothetical protein
MARQRHGQELPKKPLTPEQGYDRLDETLDRGDHHRDVTHDTDQELTGFIGAPAIGGFVAGGVIGTLVGLAVSYVPGIGLDWWAGIIIGFFVGITIGGFVGGGIASERAGEASSNPRRTRVSRGPRRQVR